MSDETPRLEGPLPPAALDDPHLQPYAKHPEGAQAVTPKPSASRPTPSVTASHWVLAATQ